MGMTIELSSEEETAYQAHALAEGLTVEQWLKRLADERVRPAREKKSPAASKTLLELFEPLRGLELHFGRSPSTGRSIDL